VITASQAGNTNFNAAPDVPQTLTVNKADQTITFEALLDKTFGIADYNLFASASSGLDVAYVSSNTAVATVTGSTVHIVAVGSTVITASQAGSSNYNAAPDVPQTLNVYTANATITLENLTTTYNGFAQAITATTSPAGLSYDVTYNGSAALPVNAGSYTVAASITDGSYHGSASGTMIINKAPLTVTADDKSKTYGEDNPDLSVTYTGFVGADDQTSLDLNPIVTTGALQNSDVGDYPVTVSGGSDDNYSFIYFDGTLSIIKANQSISFDALPDKVFGAVDSPLFATASSGLAVSFISSNTAVATVTGNMLHVVGIGTTIITASQAGSINYNAAPDVPQTLNVYTANATITLDNLTTTYSGIAQAVTATTAPAGLSVDITYDGSATLPVNAGSYTVEASINDVSFHGSASGTMTIGKASLAVKADDKTKIYGEENPVLTITYTGFLGTDAEGDLDAPPVVVTTGLQDSDAGSYPITASLGADNNYTFTYTDGVLTINKEDQVITFNALPNRTYGDADFSVSAVASSSLLVDFVSSDPAVATVTGNTVQIVGAGTTVLTASQDGSVNYNSAPGVSHSLTIDKAMLTFIADSKSKEYLAQIPALTYTISGFVRSDGPEELNTLPIITTTGLQSSDAGTYPITIAGGSDNNYTYLYIPGELTIIKILQTITVGQLPEKLLVQEEYTLEATSTSGLTVLFESLDNSIATITGDIIKGISKGTVQIRAYHPGDLNYDPAEVLASLEVYSTHKEILHLFTPNNDGFNDYWELPDMAEWGKCDVKVYSRSGKLVFSDPDYNNLWNGTSNGNPVPEGPYYFIIKTENAGTLKGTLNIVR